VGLHSKDPKGEHVYDDSFYIIFNASDIPLDFKLPTKKYGDKWTKILDTSQNQVDEPTDVYKDEDSVHVDSRTIVLLQHPII
jgi:glycogen operon protein